MLKISDCYISYVNLAHRTDREEHMKSQLERVGLTALRQTGMLPYNYIGDRNKIQVMMHRTPGAVGCWISQIEVMNKAHAENKHAFVMEDDLIFCSDLMDRLAYIDEWTDKNDWDIIWMGGTYHVKPAYWHIPNNRELPGAHLGRDAELTDDPRIIRTFGAFSTHCYIVNKNSIEKVMSMLDNIMHEAMGIDWAMIKIQPQLRTYAFAPGCVIQKDNRSDIGAGDTIFSGFARLGAHWFADNMHDFDPSTYDWAECNTKTP